MKIYLIILIILLLIILYLFRKIEKQKIKIISLSHQNSKLLKTYENKKIKNNIISNISNLEIKFIEISSQTAFLKNNSHIKIAPFDFAPKIINIKKNTEVKIISKILVSDEYWYEILVNKQNLSYNLKGWVKDCGVEFIYKTNPILINKSKDIF